MNSRQPDILDWTVTDAPEPDDFDVSLPAGEPPPAGSPSSAAAAGGERRQASRGMWLMVGGVVGLSLLALWGYSVWDERRREQQVQQVVALEEAAALAGDVERLRELYEGDDSVWRAAYLQRAENGQAAPQPMELLLPLPGPGTVESVGFLSPDSVRVEVRREYIAPDGSRVAFRLSQFYHRSGETWKRIAPPETFRGEVHEWSGRFVEVSYFGADEDFVADLGPYLDALLTQVCAAWGCPADLKFHLRFLLYDTAVVLGFPAPTRAPASPLLFALILSDGALNQGGTALSLPSPRLTGYPADAASAELLRRSIALKTLAQLANELTRPGGRDN